MIYESWVWRRGLAKASARIHKFIDMQRYREESFAITEREIMTGFFATRKLIDAKNKVSPKLARQKNPVEKFKAIKPMGNWERSEFYECFDMDNPMPDQITTLYLCNQVIHSLLFNFSWSEDAQPLGIYLASDFDRLKHCYHISLPQIAKVFDDTAASYAKKIHLVDDLKGGRNLIALD